MKKLKISILSTKQQQRRNKAAPAFKPSLISEDFAVTIAPDLGNVPQKGLESQLTLKFKAFLKAI
jgi:hypothetical protein